jgi:hypothetical protein
MNWQELYDEGCERFGGQRPGHQLEAELVDAFEQRPATVQAAVAKLADRYQAGKVRSPWPLVLAEIEQDRARARHVGDDGADRIQRVRLAERCVVNIGHVLPDEAELVEEIFGRRALLEPWAGDELLRQRMLALWGQARTPPPIEWPHRKDVYAESGSTMRAT